MCGIGELTHFFRSNSLAWHVRESPGLKRSSSSCLKRQKPAAVTRAAVTNEIGAVATSSGDRSKDRAVCSQPWDVSTAATLLCPMLLVARISSKINGQ